MPEIVLVSSNYNNIKSLATSYNNCYACAITKCLSIRYNGTISFNLSTRIDDSIRKDLKIIFLFKKISGNGLISIITSSGYNKECFVANNSKIEIPFADNIVINRTGNSIGEVSLLSVGYSYNSQIVQQSNSANVLKEDLRKTTYIDKSINLPNVRKGFAKSSKFIRTVDNNRGNMGVINNHKLHVNSNNPVNTDYNTNCPYESYKEMKDIIFENNSIEEDIFLVIGKFVFDKAEYDLFKKLIMCYGIKVVEIPITTDPSYIYYWSNKSKYVLCNMQTYSQIEKHYNKYYFINDSFVNGQNVNNIFYNLNIKQLTDKVLDISFDEFDNTLAKNKTKDVRFKIIVPSYNTEKWIRNTLQSIVIQEYKNYDVCIIDDCSTDENQKNIIKEFCDKYNSKENIWKCILNKERKYSLYNIVNGIYSLSCKDNDVCVTIDGDDALYDSKVLSKLNKIYTENDVYLTYGQYVHDPAPEFSIGHCREISKHIVENKLYRKTDWMLSHLRTFKYGLFKNIKREDFLDNDGQFMKRTGDLALTYPMAEMAGNKIMFINDIMYSYNRNTELNDDKIDAHNQARLAMLVRSKPVYPTIEIL